MKLIFSPLTIGALAFLLAGSAGAATTSGAVVATDTPNRSITIQSDDGREFRFTSNDATRIEQSGTAVTLENLREGARVTVTSEHAAAEAGSALLASRIQVDEAIAAAASGPQSEVTVESAGPDGGRTLHTVQVQSGDYAKAPPLPSAASRLPLLAMLGVAGIAIAVVIRLRRR